MRSISHLLGVEFIHNLYNRHLPRINSIRFRNTITTWCKGEANSYAPTWEWNLLQRWLGEKFFNLDPVLLREVNALIEIDRSFLNAIYSKVNPSRIRKINNTTLGLLLIDTQEMTLGEIYKINVVQVEYALTSALMRALELHEKNEGKRRALLAEIIQADIPTRSQKEEMDFLNIVANGLKLKIQNPFKHQHMVSLLSQHAEKYKFMACAYGEKPRDFEFYRNKYIEAIRSENRKKATDITREIALLYVRGQKKLRSLKDRKVSVLANLMCRTGSFRDDNKAFLGNSIKYRLILLDEIARRNLEKREWLDFYLLSEILALLDTGQKVDREILSCRKKEGVTFIREEYLKSAISPPVTAYNRPRKELTGECASPGIVEGVCSVVLHKNDAPKVKEGSIMIAVGTDFDLMEAIHKARAVITEEGGLLSHAAVVCRELGKPCCIGVAQATEILTDGTQIKLDATVGIIKIITSSP